MQITSFYIESSYARVTVGRNGPAPKTKRKTAMSDTNKKVHDLTADELEVVSGGMKKIPENPLLTAWKIAKVERENPGF
jgi:hypothetical protein